MSGFKSIITIGVNSLYQQTLETWLKPVEVFCTCNEWLKIAQVGDILDPSVLNAFLEEPSFKTTVLSRKGSSPTFPSNVNVIRADYDSPDDLRKLSTAKMSFFRWSVVQRSAIKTSTLTRPSPQA
jgi:hypothetical protein